jgi:hypothetical protein
LREFVAGPHRRSRGIHACRRHVPAAAASPMTESRGSNNPQTCHLLEFVEYQSQGERRHNDGTSRKQRISWDLGDRRKDNRGGVVQWPLLVDRPRVLKHFPLDENLLVALEEEGPSSRRIRFPSAAWLRRCLPVPALHSHLRPSAYSTQSCPMAAAGSSTRPTQEGRRDAVARAPSSRTAA